MRVLRDVMVARAKDGELHVISQAPGVVDEAMTLDLMGAGATLALQVRVLESSPVIVDGAVRHRIRLAVIEPVGGRQTGETGRGVPGVPEAV